jgi:hypothetical protein
MIPSVKTTHVVPQQLPPVRATVSTMLVCRYCRSSIGIYSTDSERAQIESMHACPEKLGLHKPAVAVPYS